MATKAAKDCNCHGSKQFTVTGSDGKTYTVRSEIEARVKARQVKGTYKRK